VTGTWPTIWCRKRWKAFRMVLAEGFAVVCRGEGHKFVAEKAQVNI
jgi:hypothetical protein